MSTVVKVENLGKKYFIGAKEAKRDTLREVIMDTVRAPFQRLSKLKGDDGYDNNSIWALKDVSFEVEQGDIIGIIGRNGAGKTTLLKIISKITEPTEGCIKIKGRVSSLLEVGTGFHAELTGRENIYLNGAILGMTRAEINSKFDEIVEFSEIGKFLDTAVKRYSSGMYVRLAFAVAAYLEPEILIIDEVLAVGDVQFQKKCLGKMREVSKGGRTVLFVSHNMGAVRNLCNNGILLQEGICLLKATSNEVVDQYLKSSTSNNNLIPVSERQRKKPPKKIRIIDVRIYNLIKKCDNEAETLDDIEILINYEVLSPLKYFSAEWMIKDYNGVNLAHSSSSPMGDILYHPKSKFGKIKCKIPKIPLSAGEYKLDVGLAIPNIEYLDYVEEACKLNIISCDPLKTGFQMRSERAPIYIKSEWIKDETT